MCIKKKKEKNKSLAVMGSTEMKEDWIKGGQIQQRDNWDKFKYRTCSSHLDNWVFNVQITKIRDLRRAGFLCVRRWSSVSNIMILRIPVG